MNAPGRRFPITATAGLLLASLLLVSGAARALDPRANIDRAVDLIEAGQYRLARCYLAPALIDWRIAASERSRAYYLRGWSFYAQDLYVSASNDYARALEFNPDNDVVLTALGNLYRDGQGVDRDQPLAVELFRKAAERGYDDAQFHLGYAYLEGQGVSRNLTLARQWLTHAADQGHALAMTNLARSYRVEFIYPPEPQLARLWYERAVQAGHQDAMVAIAYMYQEGEFGAPDRPHAVELFEQAAAAGSGQAKVNLGQHYLQDEGNPEAYRAALSLFIDAANQGVPAAYLRLGYLYEFGLGVAQSITSAEDWYTRAAESGLLYAHHRLANLLLEQDEPTSRKAALGWLERAAAVDDVDAHNHYAWLLATSEHADIRNGQLALVHARRAVKLSPSTTTIDTLAAAYAELGQWQAALTTQTAALDLVDIDDAEVKKELERHLQAYREHRAWRE